MLKKIKILQYIFNLVSLKRRDSVSRHIKNYVTDNIKFEVVEDKLFQRLCYSMLLWAALY